MLSKRMIRWAGGLLFAALLLVSAPRVSAQGCAMCYTAAAVQRAEAKQAFNLAILTLLSPVMILAGGFVFLAYKRSGAPGEPVDDLPGDSSKSREGSSSVEIDLPLDESQPRSAVRSL